MAETEINLNKSLSKSFVSLVKTYGLNPNNLSLKDLQTIGVVNPNSPNGYDAREIAMLQNAIKTLTTKEDALPLFALLRRKESEVFEQKQDDAFQKLYHKVVDKKDVDADVRRSENLLTHDYKAKALEAWMENGHFTAGKLRRQIEKGNVSNLDLLSLLAAAATTEQMYKDAAPYRDFLRNIQGEVIRDRFVEPGARRDLKLLEDRTELFEKLGVDVEKLRIAINGQSAEDKLGPTDPRDVKVAYDMSRDDGTLTNIGIERTLQAAKDTYTAMATPFYESAMGLRNPAIDLRVMSKNEAEFMGEILALREGETLADFTERVQANSQTITACLKASADIQEGHYAQALSVLSNGIQARDGFASYDRSEFLYAALQTAMTPQFIGECKDIVQHEVKQGGQSFFAAYLFADNNAYRVLLPCKPEELSQEQIDTVISQQVKSNNPQVGKDTFADFSKVKASDFKFGVSDVSEKLYDAYQAEMLKQAQAREAMERGENPQQQEATEIPGKQSYCFYRDLPLYKQYLQSSKETFRRYFVLRSQQEATYGQGDNGGPSQGDDDNGGNGGGNGGNGGGGQGDDDNGGNGGGQGDDDNGGNGGGQGDDDNGGNGGGQGDDDNGGNGGGQGDDDNGGGNNGGNGGDNGDNGGDDNNGGNGGNNGGKGTPKSTGFSKNTAKIVGQINTHLKNAFDAQLQREEAEQAETQNDQTVEQIKTAKDIQQDAKRALITLVQSHKPTFNKYVAALKSAENMEGMSTEEQQFTLAQASYLETIQRQAALEKKEDMYEPTELQEGEVAHEFFVLRDKREDALADMTKYYALAKDQSQRDAEPEVGLEQ